MAFKIKDSLLSRICFLVTIFITGLASMASGASTSWHFPQNDSVASGSAWVYPNNILTCNTASAYYMGLNIDDTLFSSNYGFSMPSAAIIDSLWYKFTGAGSSDGDYAILKIGFIAGSNRGAWHEFLLSAVNEADSARLLNFDPDIVTVSCANSTAFGLYAVTSWDEWLTDTYIDCMAIKIFYHESASTLRRQRIIRMENDR
jgi:hypothetical protein